ncbi:uncharacterized protein J8A68_003005 [[Candida] subhashii]|uniref:t-SNARE coiled-coil homology domain-containing protein n=1 Tax=[Candida] subhashii TaxID=561895 RepID=A0A8J5QN86_9ASCO|nr:uncharacterized protein J8A68_003005 [[Candida] subhashii]KAG7663458.1 hypothetical protein J8A68_003005 [[Candida] subhashii]
MSAVKIKDIKTTLGKVTICLDELASTVEERHSIFQMKLTPTTNDNFELISLLQRIVQYFKYLQDDFSGISNTTPAIESLLGQFAICSSQYNELYESLLDDTTIDIREYEYSFKRPVTSTKSVRFQESTHSSTNNNENRDELMGTRAFKPYTDESGDETISDGESFNASDNREMFAQHQQTLLRQDEDLDVLHSSIRRQHSMGVGINSELDDHLILLNDLESGVDDAGYRLNSAANRLHDFRRKAKENGSLVTIVVLTVILILLLVVLN